MSTTDLDAQVAAATAYEELFVPSLFRVWSTRVADAAQVAPGHRVLDVACGTGVAAREVAARVGVRGVVAGVDVAPGMLAVAARLAPGVELRLGRAESLPWPDGSFDRVVCQFGLMFFADRAQALREMLRVLTPGGRLAIAVWGSLEDNAAFATEVSLIERLAGPRAADALRAPFAMGNRGELTRLLQDAGGSSVAVTAEQGAAHFPSVRALVEADLRGWLPLMDVTLGEELIERILREAEATLAGYVSGDGSLKFDVCAQIATAVKP